MQPAAKILEEALELPAEERTALAHALLRSVDDEDEDEAAPDAVFAAELERRAERVANGTADLIPWEEVKASLRSDLRARREARGR